jgi:hypothetical protein
MTKYSHPKDMPTGAPLLPQFDSNHNTQGLRFGTAGMIVAVAVAVAVAVRFHSAAEFSEAVRRHPGRTYPRGRRGG